MEYSELIALAQSQPPVTISRVVSAAGPQLRALLSSGRAVLLSELQAHPDQRKEIQRFTYRHVLGPGLSASDIARWQRSHSRHQLPAELAALLQHVDGVHLWADVATGRSYFGIAALSEWSDAAAGDYRGMFQREPDGVLTLSYHENGDYVLLLDTHASEYRWHDLEDFDRPVVIGRDVQSLLEWLWGKRDELDPRRAGS